MEEAFFAHEGFTYVKELTLCTKVAAAPAETSVNNVAMAAVLAVAVVATPIANAPGVAPAHNDGRSACSNYFYHCLGEDSGIATEMRSLSFCWLRDGVHNITITGNNRKYWIHSINGESFVL